MTDTVASMVSQLAQVNIARLLAPIDSERLRGFVAGLDPINALAEASDGFVWRLQDESGNATAIRPYDNDDIAVNLSVWASIEALDAFVRSPEHVGFLRRRREWFASMATAHLALWWVDAGHRPGTAEAKDRLTLLEREGPTPKAFTLRRSFPPPG